ncbi:unnamed protein product [Rotaria magnacalcarata]|uniref:DUF547 domain-containing protein n=1 Tax=Rotaria magnacalcarata TaxID=392030 RepID=A0A815AHI9_9BILA|nr:unnamed protein product [Rotaria magnacalcarata]CAF1270375.1 unnamed protein product [Rotaria magnacalcarata]CAF3755105.1 unnamed protein product [Rotaria magnacalcarata]CAF3774201.1 unnamed protein product [Rotaria magnacalcarata]CAF3799942.1 unnamed protein product [Rotaria magnacalcarata]
MSRDNRSSSSRPFYRVKVINGVQPPLTLENNNNNNNINESDEIKNSRLLNILNWSPLESLTTDTALSTTVQINDENEPKSKNVYNAVQISIELQKKMLNLKARFIDASGRLVNYRRLRASNVYSDLCEMVNRLTTISLENVTENERKTFFINLYNILTIHGIASVNDLPKSVLDLNQFWKTTSYKVGSYFYSIDDIQHGVLRGNKPHSNCTQRHLTFNDPRIKYAMRRCDPRIHFALNCGARSCPQIAIYSSTNLEKALNMATTSFCNAEVDILLENAEVRLSKLFLWYKNDFGRSETEVLRWIAKYIDEPKQSLLKTLLDRQGSKDGLRISYKMYDWMVNNHDGPMPIVVSTATSDLDA